MVVDGDDDFQCAQVSPLISLEEALQNGYLHDGLMTSRVKDIAWLSEKTIATKEQPRYLSDYLGMCFSSMKTTLISPTFMSQQTYEEICTLTSVAALINLPPELILRIVDFLDIRVALKTTETCLYIFKLL